MVIACIAIAFLWLPSAAAQNTSPQSTLTIADAPSATLKVTNGALVQGVNATLALKNIVCSQPASFPVTVQAMGNASDNLSTHAKATPASLAFSVPAGQYVTGNGFSQTLALVLEMHADANRTFNGTLLVQLNLAAGNRSCTAQGTLPAATASAAIGAMFVGSDASQGPSPTPTLAMPVPAWAAVVALAAAVLVLRRRA
jgi:hypothetical protein